jgi:predicted phage terminase large subunit-like protein
MENTNNNNELQEKPFNIEELYDFALEHAIELAKENFYMYVKLMSPDILPEGFIDGRHIEVICDAMQEVERSVSEGVKPGRLQLQLPPGSMKSRLGNLFCSWCLGRHPNWFFLAIAADKDLAIDNYGRPVKELVDSDRYRSIFPNTILKKDVTASGRWDTTQRGRFFAAGVGQTIAGRRAHISFCDDVIGEHTTIDEMNSYNTWYVGKGLRSRLLPTGGEVIINTRWYINDLSGFTEKWDKNSERPWNIIRIPALLTEEGRTLLWREGDGEGTYAVGTSFWPEFWPTKKLLEIKASNPPADWSALYMQNPITEEGAIVKREDFKLWREDNYPKCNYIMVSLDTAFSSKETADFSAYSVWGIFKQEVTLFDGETKAILPCMLLLECDKGRWDFAELCSICQEINEDHRPDFFIVEDRASGQSLIPELRKRGMPVMPYMPIRDKSYRLQSTTPYFQAGRVWVPDRAPWAEDLVQEVIMFPKAPNDDYTDTVSQAIIWMRDNLRIDNDGYRNTDWEEEAEWSRGRQSKSYWSSLFG